MSELKNHLQMLQDMLPNALTEFVLAHGRTYCFGPPSFAGKRWTQGECFRNATLLTQRDDRLAYVEGSISSHGVPISHAWCIDRDGMVIDPTLRKGDDGHILEYFGVQFDNAYVRKAAILNGYYGLLNLPYARETLPKLLELGLERGQQWLMRKPRKAMHLTRKKDAILLTNGALTK
jgi:hypothetical protein